MAQLFNSPQDAVQGVNIIPKASHAEGYYDPNWQAGPDQPNFLNLGPLSKALQKAFEVKGEVRATTEAAAGAKAWADSPEARERFQSAMKGSSAAEATRKALGKEITKGNIPLAASPHFQLAFAQQAAQGTMQDFRAEVLQRVAEAARIHDENDKPVAKRDTQEIIDEVWAKYADGVALNTAPGQQIAAGMYSRVQNEFVSRVTQEVSTNQELFYGREYGRSAAALITEFDGALAGGALEAGQLDEFRAIVRNFSERDGAEANLQDIPGKTWLGMRDGLLVLAETNPARAQVYLTALEDALVADGGTARKLGDINDIRLDMIRTSDKIMDIEDQESQRASANAQRHLEDLQRSVDHQGFTLLREVYNAEGDPIAAIPGVIQRLDGTAGTGEAAVLTNEDDRRAAEIWMTDFANSLSDTKHRNPALFKNLQRRGQLGQLALSEVHDALGSITTAGYEELIGYVDSSVDVNGTLIAAGFGRPSDFAARAISRSYTTPAATPPGLMSSKSALISAANTEMEIFKRSEARKYPNGGEEFEASLREKEAALGARVEKESLAAEVEFTRVTKDLNTGLLDFVDMGDYIEANRDALGEDAYREARLVNDANVNVSARVRKDLVIKSEAAQGILDLVSDAGADKGVSLGIARAGVADLYEKLEDELRRLQTSGVTGPAQMEQLRVYAKEQATLLQRRLAPKERATVERTVGAEGTTVKAAVEEQAAEDLRLESYTALSKAIADKALDATTVAQVYFTNSTAEESFSSAVGDFLRGKHNRKGEPKFTAGDIEYAGSNAIADILYEARSKAGRQLTAAELDKLGEQFTPYLRTGRLTEASMLTGQAPAGLTDPDAVARLAAEDADLLRRIALPAQNPSGRLGVNVREIQRGNDKVRHDRLQSILANPLVTIDKAQVNPFTDPFFANSTQAQFEDWAGDKVRVMALMKAQEPAISDDRLQEFIDAQREVRELYRKN